MKKIALIITLCLVLVGGVFAVSVFGYVISIRNQATELETQFDAQIQANMSTHDKMWKIITGKAQVSQQYAKDFRDNFEAIMTGRYGNPDNRGSSLMLWITEKNPEFSVDLYKDLNRSIEALRTEFDMVQKKMIDIKRVHDNLRLKVPSSFAMFGKEELKLKMVTSTRTQEAFDSGIEDNMNLFSK